MSKYISIILIYGKPENYKERERLPCDTRRK